MGKCKNYEEAMSLYIDNELKGRPLTDFEAHISGCESCRRELDSLRALIEEVGRLPEMPLPANFHENMMEAIRKQSADTGAKGFFPFAYKRFVPVAACVLLCFAILGASLSLLENPLTGGQANSSQAAARGNETIMYESAEAVEANEEAEESQVYDAVPQQAGESVQGVQSAQKDYGAPMATMPEVFTVPEVSGINENGGQDALSGGVSADDGIAPANEALTPFALKNAAESEAYIIKEYYLHITVDSISDAVRRIKALPVNVDNSRIWMDNASISVSVSGGDYSLVVESLKTLGDTTSEYAYSNDVTNQIADSNTRYLVKREEVARLLALMEKAETAEDVIALETRINELETVSGTLKASYSNNVNLANHPVITIELAQTNSAPITAKKSFGDRVSSAFIRSVNFTTTAFESAAVAVSYMGLPLILVLLAAFVIIYSSRRAGKRRRG